MVASSMFAISQLKTFDHGGFPSPASAMQLHLPSDHCCSIPIMKTKLCECLARLGRVLSHLADATGAAPKALIITFSSRLYSTAIVRSESRGGTQWDFKRGIAPKQARQNFCVSCACRNTSPQLFCLQGTLQLGLLNVSFMLLTNAGWHHSDSGFVTFGCHV